jgi:uncharacterized protein (DUF169 family)
MDIAFKEKFTQLWSRFFGSAELPVVFYYADNVVDAEIVEPAQKWKCFIGELAKVRKGRSLAYNHEAVSCGGGKKYLGFTNKLRPGFEYFLSCGNEDIEGERYLQSPGLVEKFLANAPWAPAKGKMIVFKRWDMLLEADEPEVAVFFATPDVLSGLFTLAGFDREEMNGTIAPFGSGCSSIIQYPLAECLNAKPRAVLGMLDVSARTFVQENVMSFALPVKRLEEITNYMEETFLITESWEKVRRRINK